MLINKNLVLIIILVLISLSLRVYKLDQIPASLHFDEIDAGYQARSLLTTFKDYQGILSPFFVSSFVEPRTPIPIYFTAITTSLFTTPELQVRMPSAILGVLNVVLIFYLIRLLTNNIYLSFLTGLTFATNPWMIQFSRYSHEVNSSLFLILISLLLFYSGLKKRKFISIFLSSITLALTIYTYRSMSLFIPLFTLSLSFLYKEELLKFGYKKLGVILVSFLVISLSFLYTTTLGSKDTPRINQISIFQDPKVPIWIQRNRELDSSDATNFTPGKKADRLSYFFHNKPQSWLENFFNNYLQSFSTEFLLKSGDPNPRHSVGKTGELLAIDIIPLIFGLFFLGKNLKRKYFRLILTWLLIAPIPAALTSDGGSHAPRLFQLAPPLLILIGFGWWIIIKKISQLKHKYFFYSLLSTIWLILFSFYLHRYFVHFPVDSSRQFGYGFKQAVIKITQVQDQYKTIAMVPSKDPPILYYLFWSNTPPQKLQSHGTNFSEDRSVGDALDKYKVIDWPNDLGLGEKLLAYLKPDTLYLVTERELPVDLRNPANTPRGVKVVDVIKYPDNETAFYLITRDPSYQSF